MEQPLNVQNEPIILKENIQSDEHNKKKRIKKKKIKKCVELKKSPEKEISSINSDKKKKIKKKKKKISKKEENKEIEKEEDNKEEEAVACLLRKESKTTKTDSQEENEKEEFINDYEFRKETENDLELNNKFNRITEFNEASGKKCDDHPSKEKFEESKLAEPEMTNKMNSNFFFSYFNGCDKYLSETQGNNIDFTNSNNFIKKDNFITTEKEKKEEKNFTNLTINKEEEKENEYEYENNYYENNCEYEYENNEDMNKFNELFESKLKLQPFVTIPEIMVCNSRHSKFDGFNNYNMFYDNLNNNYYMDLAPENNYNYFQGNNNEKSAKKYLKYNKGFKKKCNYYMRRRGDWLCEKCGNFNFSFREVCNRCNEVKA